MVETPVGYALSEDQELIRSTARQFLADRIDLARVRDLMMSADGFDMALWREMADLGWPGLVIAEKHGGAGLSRVELGLVLEEMGRMVTPGPFFASAVLATSTVQELGAEDQKSEILGSLASGEQIAALAAFEDPRGWAWREPTTTATWRDDGWVLSGRKRSVLDGHLVDRIFVTAATGDGLGVFDVPIGSDGVEVTQEPTLDQTRRQASVVLGDVELPHRARLGDGDATEGLERVFRLARVALASEQVGGAQRCLEMSVDYAKTRYQFGRPIGSYQSIKHRCANMLMRIEHARSATYHGARVTDDDSELAVAAPLAASLASDAYMWVAGETIQVHGGVGFTWEHDAHLYLKRAKSSSLLLGSPRHERDLLGQAIGI